MSTSEILRLVDLLYGQSGDKTAKAEADKKLQILQATPASWKISLEILFIANLAEAYYFGPKALRTKVQSKCFSVQWGLFNKEGLSKEVYQGLF